MTRVLHVYAGNLYGGVEAMLAALAREPALEQHFALAWADGRLGEALAAHAPERLHALGPVRLRNPVGVLRARRALTGLIHRLRPAAVVCHSAWAQAVFGPAVLGSGRPLVFWLHDAAGSTLVERLAARVRPAAAVCTSHFAAATLPALYPGFEAEVIHPAVAAPDPAERAAGDLLRARAGVDDDEVVFIQVSRMEAWKGHTVLLEALGRLREVGDWRCWMAGGAQRAEETRYLAQLKARAAELGIGDRIAWLGERRDVPALLAAADVCVQPSALPEPFGVALVEAMYAGLPVVTADHGGARELVDRACGVRFRPGDAAALAEALRALLGPDLRRRLGGAGAARAAALCDPGERTAQLARLVDRLTGGQPARPRPSPAGAP